MSVLKQTKRLIYAILCKRKMLFFLKVKNTLGRLAVSDGGNITGMVTWAVLVIGCHKQASLWGGMVVTKLPSFLPCVYAGCKALVTLLPL